MKISEIKTISIMGFIFILLSIGVLGCDQFAGTSVPITSTSPRIDTQTSQNTEYPIPVPLTSDFPTNTKWVIKGSPPPQGIGGWPEPRTLTDDEKAKVVEIAVNSPEVLEWLNGSTNYKIGPVNWKAIIWHDGKAGTNWSIPYNDQTNVKNVSPYAYWYPAVMIEFVPRARESLLVAVDLDSGKIANVQHLPYRFPSQTSESS